MPTIRAATRLIAVGALSLLPAAEPVALAQAAFDAWSIEDGLPQNSVNDIIQTRDGYLWLATYGGLVRFDGLRFVVFDRSVDGVETLRVRVLHEDATGTLWAASDDGKLLRYRDGSFVTFGARHGLPADAALRIDRDAAGALWITWTRAVTRVEVESFTTYRERDFDRAVRPSWTPSLHFGTRTTWWSRDSDGLHCLVAGVVRTCLEPKRLPADDVVAVSIEPSGAVWIRLRREGLMHVQGSDIRRFPASAALGQLMFTDRSGRAWAYGLGGVRQMGGSEVDLNASSALAMYEDREGSIWVGTTAGLRRLRNTSFTMRSTRDGLSSNNVYAMTTRKNGEVWVGTWGDGLNRLIGGRTQTFHMAAGLPSGQVTALFEDSTERLWAGTTLGLVCFDGEGFTRCHDTDSAPLGWLSSPVWAIHEDARGDLWFGTDHGLVRRTGKSFVRFTSDDGLPNTRVTALAGDSSGVLWIGTAQGLARYTGGTFEAFGAHEGFVGNHVRALHIDSSGATWAGTYDGGLYRLKAGRLTRFTAREGLHDSGVFQILEDDRGYFWMGSNRGVQRVARAALEAVAEGRAASVQPVVFGLADGLASLECNGGRQSSGLRMPDGTLWIPTQGGIAIVDPGRVRESEQPPQVRIEELRVGGEDMLPDGSVVVPAPHDAIEIRYTALTFIKPSLVRFRHRIEGLDADWVDAGTNRTAAYYGIPPGTYRFVVTAANSDGVWSADGDRVTITVLAPFWQRAWFRIVAVVVMVAAVFAFGQRRVASLRRANAEQQAFARRLLDAQESERRRISNELHDSLGQSLFLIRKFAREADGGAPDDTSRRRVLADIASTSKAAYDEMKEIAYALRPYELDKIGASRTIRAMLQRVSRAHGLQIEDSVDDIDAVLTSDAATHVFRIVQEALNNVVRHAEATKARVTVALKGRQITIEVIDDGRGLPSRSLESRAAPVAGAGLSGIRERAKTLGGGLSLSSEPGKGARLVVTFPVSGVLS